MLKAAGCAKVPVGDSFVGLLFTVYQLRGWAHGGGSLDRNPQPQIKKVFFFSHTHVVKMLSINYTI